MAVYSKTAKAAIFTRMTSSSDECFQKLKSKVLFCYDVNAATIIFINEAFSEIWSIKRESVIANPSIILETIHSDDKDYLLKEYRDLLNGTLKQEIEFRIVLPDESIRWLLLNPQLITDEQGQPYVAAFVADTTTQKITFKTSRSLLLKRISILEILCHDLAGPLANIQNLADLLSDSTEEYENAQLNNVIKIIRESSTRSII